MKQKSIEQDLAMKEQQSLSAVIILLRMVSKHAYSNRMQRRDAFRFPAEGGFWT